MAGQVRMLAFCWLSVVHARAFRNYDSIALTSYEDDLMHMLSH